MDKIDFKKAWKHLYAPSAQDFSVVEVPALQFLMVDGHGDPNTTRAYQDALEALYAVAYKLMFLSKKAAGTEPVLSVAREPVLSVARDYVVPPLEGLWWAATHELFTTQRDKSTWDWTMMIMQPDWITTELFERAVAEVQKKALAALSKVRLASYHEGLSVQIMHIGSYEAEAPTLARMHAEFIPQNGFVEAGKHHEIYLGDPRKVAPEKLKTVLRQPVKKWSAD